MVLTVRTRETSGLHDHLGFWLRLVSNQVSDTFRQRLEVAGCTVTEWVALRTLLDADATHASLVSALGMTKGAVSKVVARLEARSLVMRKPGGDRRSHALSLTSRGRALVPELARLADENDTAFFGPLTSAQRRTLLGLLRGLARTHRIHAVPVD